MAPFTPIPSNSLTSLKEKLIGLRCTQWLSQVPGEDFSQAIEASAYNGKIRGGGEKKILQREGMNSCHRNSVLFSLW